MVTVKALEGFFIYLKDNVLNLPPLKDYLWARTPIYVSEITFEKVRREVVASDEERKQSGVPYWVVILTSRERVLTSTNQARRFKGYDERKTIFEADEYWWRIGQAPFNISFFCNSLSIMENLEEALHTHDLRRKYNITLPFVDNVVVAVLDFQSRELRKQSYQEQGTIFELATTAELEYPVIIYKRTWPTIETVNLRVEFMP